MNSGVYILPAEPHEHHRHLGPDDEVVGAKQAVAVAPGDARAGRSADCPGIPGPLRNVQEGQGAGFRLGLRFRFWLRDLPEGEGDGHIAAGLGKGPGAVAVAGDLHRTAPLDGAIFP